MSEELKTLEENGIIEKVDSSEWVSPIVITKRKNDKICLCVDLREPNKPVVPDSHPLPLIEDILSALHGSVMFSSFDLKNAYYQLNLHEDSLPSSLTRAYTSSVEFPMGCVQHHLLFSV